ALASASWRDGTRGGTKRSRRREGSWRNSLAGGGVRSVDRSPRVRRRRRGARPADPEARRRLDAEEVLDEVVPSAANEVRIVAKAVGTVRHDQEVEILVGADQRVDEFDRRRHGGVLVHIAVREKQPA